MKGLLVHVHPVFKLFTLLVMMLFVLTVTMVVGIGVAIPFTGFDAIVSAFQAGATAVENISFLRYFQVLQGLGLFVFPAFVTAWFVSGRPFRFLGFSGGFSFKSGFLLLLGVISAIPMVNYISEFNAGISLPEQWSAIEAWMLAKEEMAAGITNMFVNTDSVAILFLNLVMIALIPAVGEELIFRGVAQRILGDWTDNKHLAVWITAFVFSAIHMQFFGFIPRLLLGVLLGYIYAYSGNIWYAIWAHFVNNGFAVVLYFLAAKGVVNEDVDMIGVDSDPFFFLSLYSCKYCCLFPLF